MFRLLITLIALCLFIQYSVAQNTNSTTQDTTYQMGDRVIPVPIYHNGPVECTTCICNLNNLFLSWNKENIVNHDEIELVGYRLVDSLTDSLKIRHYYDRILRPNSYFLGYSGNTRKITLLQAHSFTGPDDKKALQYMRDLLMTSLTLNSKIYVIDLKLKDGTKIENYAVCDKRKGQISYDNMFLYLWLFKAERPPNNG